MGPLYLCVSNIASSKANIIKTYDPTQAEEKLMSLLTELVCAYCDTKILSAGAVIYDK
tara:strand:+ start:481 stop:654 length:174 start_codon:yes stop_codon:yes gene_type:complete